MNWHFLVVWIFAVFSCTVYAVYTDCERPPTILHGKTELSVDDDGIVVTAIYSCESGYQLHGQAQLICNTDTDEWQGDLPACKLETGNNSTVSEIEPPEVFEPVKTVAPELTHEEFINKVETNDVEASSVLTTFETEAPETRQTETPEHNVDHVAERVPEQETIDQDVEQGSSQPDDSQTAGTGVQKKRRRKGKVSEFQEDNLIDVDFASRLDMSCIEGTAAPAVNDAYVVEYIQAKKEDYKFLVAVYACDEDFYLENPQMNRLYCSQGSWVGNYPICVSKGESDVDYGNETDDDDQNENDDTNKTNAENVATNSLQQNNEFEKNAEKIEPIEMVPAVLNNNVDEQIATNEIIQTIATVAPSTESHSEISIDSSGCDLNNGGCEQTCTMVPDEEIGTNVVECSCRAGFYLDSDEGKKCLDINECENPNTCPNECENTIGSYRCVDDNPEVEIIPTNVDVSHTTEFNAPVKACGDGLRMDDSNNCKIDIDECAEGNTGCEYCQNTIGGFQCTCPDGFELNNDEKTCRDIDECTTFSDYEYDENTPTARSICSHECINTIGSYICRCPGNFHLRDDKRTCEQDFCRHLGDVTANKTKCSHDCVDDVDGYHCKCPDNMKLGADGKSCNEVALDACATSGDRCLPGKCINTPNGSFRCECPTGFAEYNQRCVDYDECAILTHKCSHKCKNIDGSYLCECPDDLVLASDKHTCVSLDYCATDNGGCSDICNVVNEKVICSCLDGGELDADGFTCRPKNICESNNGGCQQVCNVEFNRCECFPGYETFDDGKTCRDLNECLQNNGGCPQQCINTEGGYECTCFDGMTKDETNGDCVDHNECETNNANCDHDCQNVVGSYVCACRAGYSLAADQHHCFDTNECDVNNGNCSHTCINLQGSYQCSCPEGQFLVNDDHTCEFLNECEVNNGGCSHKCNYKKGVLNCSCPVGFELDDTGKLCIDQNECLINNGGCAHHCDNLNGTHVCRCNAGYQLASDKYGCLDVDECIENNGNCSNICINLLGSYTCACEAGYELKDDKHTCYDIDECADAIHDCEQNCVNVPGAYECDCRSGYKLDRDHLSCKDVDECATNNGGCEQKCVNIVGSWHCECDLDGFALADDNKSCVGSDPCGLKNGGCAHVCEPLNGKAQCFCYKGFELSASDNKSCSDINECLLNHGCESKCINTVGSYKCDCPKGFRLNGAGNCEDVNECEVSVNGGCSPNSECINFLGSFRCICPTGYKLDNDKVTCVEIKDSCLALTAPEHGDVRCTRSRHMSQSFYRTKCSFWCNEGYTLLGSSVKYCNGSDGIWDTTQVTCSPSTCPPLAAPALGTFPSNCLNGKMFPGESCAIICPPGTKNIGVAVTQCLPTRRWSSTNLNCVAVKLKQKPTYVHQPEIQSRTNNVIKSKPKVRTQGGEIHSRGHIDLDAPVPASSAASPAQTNMPMHVPNKVRSQFLRPSIICPRDTTIVLPKNKRTIYVKLEQPKSNVDWASHIDVSPAWAKNLQAHLGAGVHTITFRARSPHSASISEVCRTVITVKSSDITQTAQSSAPQITYCPQTLEVQLQPNEVHRLISWREPAFRSVQPLKQIFKSNLPGTRFSVGQHKITYIATDIRNQNATCQFTIVVRPSMVSRIISPYVGQQFQNHLDNHESYLLCPGKPAMKLDTNFPIQIPDGCYIKNIRVNQPVYNPHRRRQAYSPNNHYLRYYSSWNRPEFNRYYM